MNDRLAAFLAEEGLVPAGCRSLGITGVDAMARVDTDTLVDLCVRAIEAAPDSDAILLSCGGLQTLDAIPEVERRLGVPVVSSSPAGFWDAVRLAGGGAKVAPGYGRLLGA